METALCLLYLIMGCWSIGYIKHDFLGWTTFTTSLGSYYISNMALGFCFGFLTIPFALLHMLVFSKKQLAKVFNLTHAVSMPAMRYFQIVWIDESKRPV